MMSKLERELSEMSFAEDRKAAKLAREGKFIEAHDCEVRKEAYAEAARMAEKYFETDNN